MRIFGTAEVQFLRRSFVSGHYKIELKLGLRDEPRLLARRLACAITATSPPWVQFLEDDMSDSERIKLLETALIKYVELYGFIDEARAYYIRNGQSENGTADKHS